MPVPYSDVRPRPWVLEQLRNRGVLAGIGSVLDVGAGAGGWHDFLNSQVDAHWTAVEVWEPYITRFALRDKYDLVVNADVRTLIPFPAADLVIFGDVLEHMTDAEALACWRLARARARWVVASLPVYERYEQGALEGNPYEEHLHHWDVESFLLAFSGVLAHSPRVGDSCAGAFLARGKDEPA